MFFPRLVLLLLMVIRLTKQIPLPLSLWSEETKIKNSSISSRIWRRRRKSKALATSNETGAFLLGVASFSSGSSATFSTYSSSLSLSLKAEISIRNFRPNANIFLANWFLQSSSRIYSHFCPPATRTRGRTRRNSWD